MEEGRKIGIAKTILIAIISWTWGIIATLMGFVCFIATFSFGKVRWEKGHPFVLIGNYWGAFTLGWFTIMDSQIESRVFAHETGHTIQNCILGPLSLIVIALPSIIHAGIWSCFNSKKSYYKFYTEAWANHLIKVDLY